MNISNYGIFLHFKINIIINRNSEYGQVEALYKYLPGQLIRCKLSFSPKTTFTKMKTTLNKEQHFGSSFLHC